MKASSRVFTSGLTLNSRANSSFFFGDAIAKKLAFQRTAFRPIGHVAVLVDGSSSSATISFATGDPRAGTVMSLMVILGVSLRFVQEARADAAAAKLKAMITLTTAVVRAGKAEEIPIQELAPGDVVTLCAGDMIPADVRIISAKDLFVSQATLTGESLPVEKLDSPEARKEVAPLEFANICFLGTSVESGAATAVVVATGTQTCFGSMASSIVGEQVVTSFDKGMQQFTWLMIRFMMVMVPLVFFINGFTKHNWHEACIPRS